MERKWWTLVAVVVGVFILVLDILIVNIALPDIGKDFDSSLSDLQWVVDAYALALAAGLLMGGSIADLWGRRRVYAAGLAIFTLGSLLCGLATGPLFLAIARAGQGVGGAVVWATSLALLSNAFRGKDRGVAFGIYGAVLGVGAAAGPLLGGLITSGLSWRWIFFVNIPIGIATIAVTLLKVSESRSTSAGRPDLAGFGTFAVFLTLLIYGLIESGRGWGRESVYLTLIGAAIALALFVVVEWKARSPMLDLALFRNSTFDGGLLAAFGLNASLYALITYLIIYLQQQLGYSAFDAGLRSLPLTASMAAASTVAGRLTNVISPRAMIGGGFLAVGTGVLLMTGLYAGTEWTHLLPGMIVAGIGGGFVTVPLASTAVGVVEASKAGMASGANATARQIGLATGIAVLGSIFAATSHTEFTDGLNVILIVGSVLAYVSAVLAFSLIRGQDFVQRDASELAVDQTPVPSAST